MVRVFVTHNREDLEAYFGRALPNLEEIADVVLNQSGGDLSTPDLIASAAGCEVVVAHRSTPGPAELFESSPDLLAFLRTAVDLSTVDVPAASACGVLVARADKSFVASTAELALALTLDLARAVSESTHDYRDGVQPEQRTGRQLRGRTAGIIGFGSIGSYLAEALRALGVEVVVCDPFVDATAQGFEQVDLDTLLDRSDIVYPARSCRSDDGESDRRACPRSDASWCPARQRVARRAARRERRDVGARFRAARRAGHGRRPCTRSATVTRVGPPRGRRRHAPSRRTHPGERRRTVGECGCAGAIDHRPRDAAASRQPRVGTTAPAVVGRELNERPSPPGACDTHMHFYDAHYPPAATSLLRPPDALVAAYREVQRALGLERS